MEEFDDGFEEVAGLEAGAGDVLPDGEGVLVDGLVGEAVGVGMEGEEAGEELHVEDPAGVEGAGEDLLEVRGDAEEFGAALGVVDGDVQESGDDRGEDAPEIMADGAPVDRAAEQADAGTEDHFEFRLLLEQVLHCEDGREWCGEVGIPEAAEPGGGVGDGVEQTITHGFGFAAVGLQVEHFGVIGMLGLKSPQQGEGSIAAAVVDEEEANGMSLDQVLLVEEVFKGVQAQAFLFVEAGHDDGTGADFVCGTGNGGCGAGHVVRIEHEDGRDAEGGGGGLVGRWVGGCERIPE